MACIVSVGCVREIGCMDRFGRLGCLMIWGLLGVGLRAEAQPSPAALAAFNSYAAGVESRLARQHSLNGAFVAMTADAQARLRRGEIVVEKLTPERFDVPGAMLHHWRGTAFVPGATVADFERVMRDTDGYPRYFSPQVVWARTVAHRGDVVETVLRVRQKHVLTVVLDTAYDVRFARMDEGHGFSISRSTRIAEVDDAATPEERVLGPGEDHGFLWRMNTYWSYEERDGGLYMQIESASLTRAIPTGLGWAVRPFVEKVPRESLEFTLRRTCEALRKVSR